MRAERKLPARNCDCQRRLSALMPPITRKEEALRRVRVRVYDEACGVGLCTLICSARRVPAPGLVEQQNTFSKVNSK